MTAVNHQIHISLQSESPVPGDNSRNESRVRPVHECAKGRIAPNHLFVDGNKRTGHISGMTFVQVNGVVVVTADLNDAQMGVWLEQVVNRELTFETFVARRREWLARP